jgi:hypothetical protein
VGGFAARSKKTRGIVAVKPASRNHFCKLVTPSSAPGNHSQVRVMMSSALRNGFLAASDDTTRSYKWTKNDNFFI